MTCRSITGLFLALVLAVTSQAVALARGEGAVSGVMVICVGGGLAAVPVGPDGQPVGHPHVCPDAVGVAAGAAALPIVPRVSGAVRAAGPGVSVAGLAAGQVPGLPAARAPPGLV